MRVFSRALFLILTISLCFPCAALATGSSGFELGTNSARSLGRGNAVTADPEEPAAIAFNPAGMTSLEGHQISNNASIITASTDYTGANGATGEDSATLVSPAPSFFVTLSTPIKELKVGAGVNSPFGLSTQYSSVGNFRYLGNYNQIKTIGYNLSGAYQVRPGLSIGGGFTYINTDLKQVGKINSNLIAFNQTGVNFNAPDSPYELDVNGSGIGYNLGAQINHNDKHFVGLFYRSQVRATYKGDFNATNFQDPVTQAVFGGTSYRTGAKTHVTFPGSFTFGYKYKISQKWDISSDLTWTQWSTFDRVDIDFSNTNAILQSFTPINENFKDVFSLNLGTSYELNDNWAISGGYFFYQMSASKSTYSNAIPDGNRNALCLGLEYKQRNYSIYLSYVGEIISITDIDNNVGAISNATVDGDYLTFVNIISLQSIYKF